MVCGGVASKVLEEKVLCSTAANGRGVFYRINKVNGYLSFIKERKRRARGFGTKYLNRYNTLFRGYIATQIFLPMTCIKQCVVAILRQ
jgi:hypothetical protein